MSSQRRKNWEVVMRTKTLMMKEIRTFVFEGLRVVVCPITSIKISISGEAACGARVTPSHSPHVI